MHSLPNLKMCTYVYRAIFRTIIATSSDNLNYSVYVTTMPILVSMRSKAWICCHPLAGIVASNPTVGMDVFLLRIVCVVR